MVARLRSRNSSPCAGSRTLRSPAGTPERVKRDHYKIAALEWWEQLRDELVPVLPLLSRLDRGWKNQQTSQYLPLSPLSWGSMWWAALYTPKKGQGDSDVVRNQPWGGTAMRRELQQDSGPNPGLKLPALSGQRLPPFLVQCQAAFVHRPPCPDTGVLRVGDLWGSQTLGKTLLSPQTAADPFTSRTHKCQPCHGVCCVLGQLGGEGCERGS